MQMQRAFNAKMMTKLTLWTREEPGGYYNSDNHWVVREYTEKTIRGVIVAGNKFSQFEEGQAIQVEDGGQRISDYRTLYVTDKYPIQLGDKLEINGNYFNTLQRSDEVVFGFYSLLIEKSQDWTPPAEQIEPKTFEETWTEFDLNHYAEEDSWIPSKDGVPPTYETGEHKHDS